MLQGPEILLDVLDSEILLIEAVHRALKQKEQRSVFLQGFDEEIHERYLSIGFKVNTDWYTSNLEGVFIVEVQIIGRVNPRPFDHERQRYEVINDVLGISKLDKGQTIKMTKSDVKAINDATRNGHH